MILLIFPQDPSRQASAEIVELFHVGDGRIAPDDGQEDIAKRGPISVCAREWLKLDPRQRGFERLFLRCPYEIVMSLKLGPQSVEDAKASLDCFSCDAGDAHLT
ncbi:uncharacterized protein LOC112638429 [Camponotus floridanus]|uniref:uncharacterized protein LOC112638429 n=1 Tax=Camponotus floridanus TaxID=104421 RepID=UPI000DC668B3|nr:uncharacterized protein LOC112638429 [Camponotus floridanus]